MPSFVRVTALARIATIPPDRDIIDKIDLIKRRSCNGAWRQRMLSEAWSGPIEDAPSSSPSFCSRLRRYCPGREAGSQTVSEKRAREVADLIVTLHVTSERHVVLQGTGAKVSVATDDTEASREQARRVDIQVFAQERGDDESRLPDFA
jgi:hypothetical protein